jgi:hypothetical protein
VCDCDAGDLGPGTMDCDKKETLELRFSICIASADRAAVPEAPRSVFALTGF